MHISGNPKAEYFFSILSDVWAKQKLGKRDNIRKRSLFI
jgi:hypothetical protein